MGFSDNIDLQISNLSVCADGKTLLDGVSLELSQASVMAVIGPNGAGKSTLLKAVGGEYPTSGGRVHWRGRDLGLLSLQERARCLAVMPQLTTLPFPFSAGEVVSLGRLPHSSGVEKDKAVVRQVMELLDVYELHDRPYPHLSGGEKQRVQLARAIAQVWDEEGSAPRLLLLDEPSSALDIGHQQQLVAVLRRLKQQNLTIIMAVHDLNLAAACADQILALKSGRQLQVGRCEEVLSASLLSELFNASLQVINDDQWGRPVIVGIP